LEVSSGLKGPQDSPRIKANNNIQAKLGKKAIPSVPSDPPMKAIRIRALLLILFTNHPYANALIVEPAARTEMTTPRSIGLLIDSKYVGKIIASVGK
jgi:hypothetical protein